MSPCIRIRFVTADGWISAGIRWVTNSLFSHVEFGTPAGTWIGAHADGGVMERPGNYCTPTREYVYEIPCSQAKLNDHLVRLRSKIGTPYNKLDILGLLIKNRKLTTPHQVICSQFMTDECLILWGAPGWLNVLPGYSYLTTPEIDHLAPILVGHRVKKVG